MSPAAKLEWKRVITPLAKTRLYQVVDRGALATYAGAELDLLIIRGRRRLGFEFKRTTSPSRNRSMRTALEVLDLDRLDVIHAVQHTFPLQGDRIRAVAFERIYEDLEPLT